jgi:epoxyqueuosine reductase
MKVRHGLDAPALPAVFRWTQAQFEARMRGSAVYRIGYERWSRNVAVALGNAPRSADNRRALEERREDGSALVREHVAWALARQRLTGT